MVVEPVYKIGDVLEFPDAIPEEFRAIPTPVRGIIMDILQSGFEYVFYDIMLFSKEDMAYTRARILQSRVIPRANKIGHIDISLLRFEGPAAPEKNIFDALRIPKFVEFLNQCCDVKRLRDEIEVLTKEVSDLREQNKALSDRLGDDALGQKQIPTPQEFENKMREILDQYGDDEEVFHIAADHYICDVMEDLGYEEGIHIFAAADKWYS